MREYILLTQEDREKIRQFFNEYINPFHRPENPVEQQHREKVKKDLWGIPLGTIGAGVGGGVKAVETLGWGLKHLLRLDFTKDGITPDKTAEDFFGKGYKWARGDSKS